MTSLALRFQAVSIASIGIEFRPRFGCTALSADLTFRSVFGSKLVLSVPRWRIPSQIFQTVVARIGVGVVATVLSWRWLSNKGQQHKPVDLSADNLPVDVEVDHDIAGPASEQFEFAWFPQTSCATVIAALPLERPDRAIAADKIIRETWDRAYVLFHSMTIHTTTHHGKRYARS